MNKLLSAILVIIPLWSTYPQTDSLIIPESQELDLQLLVAEAQMNNPDIRASVYEMDILEARTSSGKGVPSPQLKFTQENMPDFKFNEAMFSRLELMQEIPFPTKLGGNADLARIRAEHAHHEHLEKVNEIIARLKSAYYELWFAQQNLVLGRENARLVSQFIAIAGTKYTTGNVPQQDLLKAKVELLMIGNENISLRQKELSAKAMLMSILNRQPKDTLGFATIPEEVVFDANLDSLLDLALHNRPMLKHDSLGMAEGEELLSIAKQEYFPDMKFALERITSPSGAQEGWSVSAGISLPFAPWVLGKSGSGVEEASTTIQKATAKYQSSKAMVEASVKDLYFKAQSAKAQLDVYRTQILPQAKQSLVASSAAYRAGSSDFLMLIDAYRTNVNLTKEYFLMRMEFDSSVSALELEVGSQNISLGVYERNSQ